MRSQARTIALLLVVLLAPNATTLAQESDNPTSEALTPPSVTSPNAVVAGSQSTATGVPHVTNRAVQVLAAPSSSASVLYGFPAGRPVRVIGEEAGFAQIQDMKSSATGWVEQAALTESAIEAPVVSSQSERDSAGEAASIQQSGASFAPTQNSGQSSGRRGNSRNGPLSGFFGGIFGGR